MSLLYVSESIFPPIEKGAGVYHG